MQTTFTILGLAFALAFHLVPAIIHHRALGRDTKED